MEINKKQHLNKITLPYVFYFICVIYLQLKINNATYDYTQKTKFKYLMQP